MDYEKRQIPKIDVGQHAGTPIDQLPVSYCRWMLFQDFPKEWLDIARKKVDASPHYNTKMIASIHAIDMYSVRFLKKWTAYKVTRGTQQYDGIATFVVKQAEEAWEKGSDVSKKRHKKDGIVKHYKGIKYVYNQSKHCKEYIELITVM